MSYSAVMERPTARGEEQGWVFITPSTSETQMITAQGSGRDRLYLIPSGHLMAAGRESVSLPSVDDLI